MMLFSLVLLLWFALANLHLTGMGVMAVGLCANVVPIVVNQGMPVRAEALVHADVARADDVGSIELSGGRHLERPSDDFVVLADIIPVPAAGQVVSFGDLIIFVATIDVIVHLVRRQRHTPAHVAGRRDPRDGLRRTSIGSAGPCRGRHHDREPGPRLGRRAEAGAVVGIPELRQSRRRRAERRASPRSARPPATTGRRAAARPAPASTAGGSNAGFGAVHAGRTEPSAEAPTDR